MKSGESRSATLPILKGATSPKGKDMDHEISDFLGLDIGGTHIRIARVDGQGRILARHAVPSPRDAEAVTRLCIDLVTGMRGAATAAVGIGVPGQVDFATQRVLSGGYVDLSSLPFAALVADRKSVV